jgi:hypothetical protein
VQIGTYGPPPPEPPQASEYQTAQGVSDLLRTSGFIRRGFLSLFTGACFFEGEPASAQRRSIGAWLDIIQMFSENGGRASYCGDRAASNEWDGLVSRAIELSKKEVGVSDEQADDIASLMRRARENARSEAELSRLNCRFNEVLDLKVRTEARSVLEREGQRSR